MAIAEVPGKNFREQPAPAECETARVTHPEIAQGFFDPSDNPTRLLHDTLAIGKETVHWTMEIPEHLRYEGMAVIVPGWLGIKQCYRALRHRLASQEGITTLTYTPARDDGSSLRCIGANPQELHTTTLLTIASNLRSRSDISATTIYGDHLNTDRKILIPHSMGGLSAPLYALQEQSAVEAIYGSATCGFGQTTPFGLGKEVPRGALSGLQHELIPAIMNGNIEASWRNIGDLRRYCREIFRVAAEGISCMTTDVIDEVALLKDNGVPYHYEAYQHDILVAPNPLVSQLVSSHKVIKGAGHLQPQKRPERVATRIASYLFSQ